MSDIFVQDLRDNNSPSLSVIPDLGVRIAFVEQQPGAGYELVLLDKNNNILGSAKFV